MSNSYLNVMSFLLTTFLYYITLKPTLSYAVHSNKTEYNSYIRSSYMYLAIYVILVILIQSAVNSSIITSKCGGTFNENVKTSFGLTCMPWVLMFGVLVVVLAIFPGFKSAFSDVIGYYYVSDSATKLLNELLMDKNDEQKLLQDPAITPEKQSAFKSASDAIVKICRNNSIVINQIVPNNFDQYWSILTPLMKDKYKYDNLEIDKIKNELFELAVSKDNIGEAIWYIYTGLLLTLIVQFKINNYKCK